MLKYLLSLFSILVLLLPTLLLPAEACPVKLPETLLSLYANSDAIYVARFDKVEDYETIESSDERSIVRIVKHFDVSSALKGETRKLFTIDERDYRYKRDLSNAEEEEVASEQAEEEEGVAISGSRNLKSGDQVLLFLKMSEDGKTLELTDSRDGIKKMTPARLGSYEARINELNSIFSRKTIDNAEIVEWLVACVQDPRTRWEGAYQLQRSFEQLEWLEEQKEESEENEGSEEAVSEGESETADSASGDSGDAETNIATTFKLVQPQPWDIAEYARLLTDAQKDELMKVLVDRPSTTDDGKEVRLTHGDRILIDVVSNWGDQRFVKFLLDRLQASSTEPYQVSQMMSTIAKVLSDDELSRIAEKYSDVDHGDDDDAVEVEELEETSNEAESEATEAEGEISESTLAPEPESKSKQEPTAEVTYKGFRSALMSKFLDRSFVLISIADSKGGETSTKSR